MCGIFGVISARERDGDRALVRSLTSALSRSETHGREAVGIAVHDFDSLYPVINAAPKLY